MFKLIVLRNFTNDKETINVCIKNNVGTLYIVLVCVIFPFTLHAFKK